MGGFSRLIKVLVVLSVLGTAGAALWKRKDQVKEVWGSLGGIDGVVDSANRLADSVGPFKDFVTQMSRLKK